MLRAQLDALGEAMMGHEGPIILAGDFNTWSKRRLETVQELAARFGLCEIDIFPPGRTGGDLPGDQLERLLGMDPTMPLDRVYVRGFSIISADVLSVRSSDHRPIMVTIGLDQARSSTRRRGQTQKCPIAGNVAEGSH